MNWPIKVWTIPLYPSLSHSIFIIISSCNISLFLARQLFNFGSDVTLNVFEEDGTEVTSNEYMLFLEKFTKLVMVPEEQTESPAITENNHSESINKSYTLIKFLKKFVNKPEFMSLLSPDELNAVTTFTEDQPTDGVAEGFSLFSSYF